MKRIAALLLVAVMLFTFPACGKKKKSGGDNMVQITFCYENGTEDEVFYIKKGSIVPKPRVKNPTKDGCKFTRWGTRSEDGNSMEREWDFGKDVAVYDTVIYAYYE